MNLKSYAEVFMEVPRVNSFVEHTNDVIRLIETFNSLKIDPNIDARKLKETQQSAQRQLQVFQEDLSKIKHINHRDLAKLKVVIRRLTEAVNNIEWDQPPAQRVERHLAGLMIATDHQQILAGRAVPPRRIIVDVAVAHLHAIQNGIAQRSAALDDPPAHDRDDCRFEGLAETSFEASSAERLSAACA